MAMVCPQCTTSHEQRLLCPTCGSRLAYRELRGGHIRSDSIARGWQQTAWGRVLIGVGLTQGLLYGLCRLCAGVLLGVAGDGQLTSQEVWQTEQGVILLQALQVLSLLLGTMLTGSGQKQGPFLGAVVGVWNGVFCELFRPVPVESVAPLALYAQPILQAVVGILGGWSGRSIWKPLQPTVLPGSTAPAKGPVKAARRKVSPFAGPIAWFRVGLGTAVVVAGCLSSTFILNFVLAASNGQFSTETHFQDKVVTWEIRGLTVLLGGALAGALTANGLKQGLVVGLASSSLLLGFQRGLMSLMILTVLVCLGLGLAGGWFGSQLFPPVVRLKRNRDCGPAAA